MPEQSWTDRIVGERMAVDREFSSRIANSRFSSQEWGLIMTATELKLENPEEPESARIVADTSKVEQILPELENVRSQVGAMGGQAPEPTSGGGIVDSLKRAVGLGDEGVSDAEREAAAELTAEYARQLQTRLESAGRWESVCRAAADADDQSPV